MALAAVKRRVDGEDLDQGRLEKAQDEGGAWGARDDELCNEESIRTQILDLMKTVSKGFKGQWERGNDQLDWWDVYTCVLGGRQVYNGNSQIFVPIVRVAVDARQTRFINQMFPRSGRNVDCITSEDKPWDLMSLLEHYIRKTKLRTQIFPALLKNGDVEGHYNLYVTWGDVERHVAYKKSSGIQITEDLMVDDDGADLEEEYDVVEETITHSQPIVEVLSDADVLVFPPTATSIEHALAMGGGVAIIRRWTKEKIKQMIEDGEVDEEAGEELMEQMKKQTDDPNSPDAVKKHNDAAGVTLQDGMSIIQGYEVWSNLKKKKERRLCRTYYGGGEKDTILGCKRNPYWCDKVPVLSAPIDKLSGTFKGLSKVKFVADLQYAANDAINEAWDSAQYALMPIVMTDPTKNPRTGSMVLNLAAIWETNPRDTQFASFPPLWKDGFTLVAQTKQEIFQALSVTPAMMPQSTGGKQKRNQAEIAAEQQADILSTADAVTNIEDEIATPLLRWFVDLDHQFRDKATTIRQYGELGVKLSMVDVPPIQSNRRFEFRWWGVEAARSSQALQQQIAAVNVVKGIPPQTMVGYKLNMVPFVQLLLENSFGSRVSAQLFESVKDKLSVDPEMENRIMTQGFALPVHELDDDKAHMMSHIKYVEQHGDQDRAIQTHMFYHREQMNRKLAMEAQGAASMMAGANGGAPGGPGGAGPGVAGTPRPGAQPGQARGGQLPPGAIHQDRMVGTQEPRR
jgi:hypothetical protein